MYRFKKAWRDGTHAVVLSPEDLIARLCALVPPPRFHLIRYLGVLAGHSSLRADVVRLRIVEIAKKPDDVSRVLAERGWSRAPPRGPPRAEVPLLAHGQHENGQGDGLRFAHGWVQEGRADAISALRVLPAFRIAHAHQIDPRMPSGIVRIASLALSRSASCEVSVSSSSGLDVPVMM